MKNIDDFNDFQKNNTSAPPLELTVSVLKMVRDDLQPSFKIVISKLIVTQLILGFITLLFCPQFNLSLTSNLGLFHYLHNSFGSNVCMVMCGGIFMGFGAFFVSSVLSESEIKLIRSKSLILYLALSIFVLPIFMIFGADIYKELTYFWVVGATFCGFFMFDLGLKVKRAILI